VQFLDKFLRIKEIKDASCNGLQVQGSSSVSKIGVTVDASLMAYEKAVEEDCQMVIAHHGMIWGGLTSVTGISYKHIRYLFDHDLNLYAAHLPLDLHASVGNNVQLAAIVELQNQKPFGSYNGIEIGFEGSLPEPKNIEDLVTTLQKALGGEYITLPFGKKRIQRIGIISGGAARELSEAIEKEIDCYITGEPNHSNYHTAREAGINVIYCGHYHSETVGVKALADVITEKFNVETVFLDIPTTI